MDWDDFRYFAALAQNASVRGAAEDLGVNASTVTRRLEHLETELGVVLFERTGKGLNITTEGVEVAQRVDEVARHFRLLESSVKGRNKQLAGLIRVSIPDVLANNFLLGDLAPFLEMYPEIELALTPAFRTPAQDVEIDVRVTVTDSPPDWMVGRRLGRFGLAVYGAESYLDAHSAPSGDGQDLTWVGWAATGELMQFYERLQLEYFPHAKGQLHCDQVEMQRAALRAGMGVGILPTFLGEPDPLLRRLEQMPVQESPSLWVLTHPNARSTRRIQVFLEYVREVFINRQDEIFV